MSDDLRLARGARAGHADDEARFVERMRCIPRILSIKNARLGHPLSPEDLADLAQETFTIVWRKLDTFRGDAALESWVYPFCVLSLLGAARRRARAPVALEAEVERAGDEVDAELEPLDAAHLHAALARLERDEAVVIELKQFEDLTFEAIGQRLAISPSTAKTRYYRGLTRLRTLLAERSAEARAAARGGRA